MATHAEQLSAVAGRTTASGRMKAARQERRDAQRVCEGKDRLSVELLAFVRRRVGAEVVDQFLVSQGLPLV